jgi:hypothetical protein
MVTSVNLNHCLSHLFTMLLMTQTLLLTMSGAVFHHSLISWNNYAIAWIIQTHSHFQKPNLLLLLTQRETLQNLSIITTLKNSEPHMFHACMSNFAGSWYFHYETRTSKFGYFSIGPNNHFPSFFYYYYFYAFKLYFKHDSHNKGMGS